MLRISTLSSATLKIPLASLELQVRTYNALRMKFGDEIPTETQIRGLPHIRNFGACCMVDLLVAVEFFSSRLPKTQQLELSVQTEPATIVSPEDWPSRIEVEISHYPRPGYRIAPKALKSVLNVPAWSQRLAHMQLCDLDESTWGKISPAQCRKLAAAVIERVKIIRGSLRNVAEQIKLPMPKTKGKPINLQLERRTFNCLNKMGLLDNPSRLVVKDSQAWGLGPLFRRRGGDPGDSLRILFDLKTKNAIAELGQASVEEADEVNQQA